MSTYEVRCANVVRDGVRSYRPELSAATPERIEAAVQRGRRERSLAMWSILQAVFGRPEAREQDEVTSPAAERSAGLTR